MSTNIVTVRTYPDGSEYLSINGHDIPDMVSVVHFHTTDAVTITIKAAQYNSLLADEPVNPQLRALLATPKRSWWSKVINRRA